MKTGSGILKGLLSLTSVIHVHAAVHYVDLNSTNATSPFTNWITAATNIQDAVDAATAGDEIVVTNGVYATGGRSVNGVTTNRVAVDKPLTVRSVNGSEFTVIDGADAARCVYLTNSATLSGLTLSNGWVAFGPGGGVFCESQSAVVTNCVVTANGVTASSGGGAFGGTLNRCTVSHNAAGTFHGISGSGGGAYGCVLDECIISHNGAFQGGGVSNCTVNNTRLTVNDAVFGGGAAGGTLNNCEVSGNSVTDFGGGAGMTGGGAFGCTLNNCTVAGNSAFGAGGQGGGAASCTLNNCIIYFNSANLVGPNCSGCTLNYSCTAPLPTNGVGNIASDPLFVDTNNWADLRLQSSSPCINAGNNDYAPAGPDLSGNPRIAGGMVDVGAYEFQAPVSKVSYAWLQQHGLPINATTDTADPDGDGVDNYHEWLANSDPTNPFSFPPLLTMIPYGPNLILTWPTNAVGFRVQSATNLNSPIIWSSNSPGPVVIGGQNVVISPISSPRQFYRLIH